MPTTTCDWWKSNKHNILNKPQRENMYLMYLMACATCGKFQISVHIRRYLAGHSVDSKV